MFDAEEGAVERLRDAEAWDVGLLVLHIGAHSPAFMLCHEPLNTTLCSCESCTIRILSWTAWHDGYRVVRARGSSW